MFVIKFTIPEHFLEKYPDIIEFLPKEFKVIEFVKQSNGLIEIKAS